jgi:hypothetical protein
MESIRPEEGLQGGSAVGKTVNAVEENAGERV